ncbi:MAG: N-formylglutamate amidohydrolase [Helicobacteraceae bacterium]|jgi:N-formylglutamate deformylase|nr:N-formylglutamate amidohydrolase [Helicobacteraceae bacterium]
MNKHYLIHLPHCGTDIPNKFLDNYSLSKDELNNNVYQYCALYTDDLFGNLFDRFGGVKNTYSRLFFDPERFGNDTQEEMYKKFKLGWFYENSILSEKPLRTIENKSKIRKYFDKHHNELNKKTKQKLDIYGKCTVIDCHSFSNERYWFHDENLPLVDICIGFEDEHINQELVEIVKDEFKEYDIGINVPYEGSLVPTDYWGKDNRVKSVKIKINKKLYLESDNITKSNNYNVIKQKIDNISKRVR